METKRCAQCHKLLRAETHICSRCGYIFSDKKKPITKDLSRPSLAPAMPRRKLVTRDFSRPSLPPASPHRAGHYSGLHPEDAPYQSSMIAVQHPPARDIEPIHDFDDIAPLAEDVAEVEDIVPEVVRKLTEQPTLPPRGDDAPTAISERYENPHKESYTESHIPSVPPILMASEHIEVPYSPHEPIGEIEDLPYQSNEGINVPYLPREKPLSDTDGALAAHYQPRQAKRTGTKKRAISLLLTLSCIFFLLASGILVYISINNKPSSTPGLKLGVTPATVRAGDTFTLSGSGFTPATRVKFTYDDEKKPLNDTMGHQLTALVDNHSGFSIDVITPSSWSADKHTIYATDDAQIASAATIITVEPQSEALPLLQLSTTKINMGIKGAGTTSSQQITLKNAGGGKLTWQQKSDAAWLTVAPVSGNSYTFAGSALVNIIVNRSNLVPNTQYTGHITFSQKDGSNKSTLTVAMGVDATPALLNVSPLSLIFATASTQSAPTQSVTLQNSGEKAVDWRASATTSDGANWLYVSTPSGHIDAKQSQKLAVGVQAQMLAAGSYQGTITLSGGANASINVSLTVNAAGNILVTPTTLNFTGFMGQSVASKGLTLQNVGGQAQTWNTIVSVDQGNWLSTTQQSGVVNAGTQATVTVNINTAGLTASSYQGSIEFAIGNQLTFVPITLTLTPPPVAVISVLNSALTFQTTQNSNPASQTLTIKNTGNAVLNWIASESGNGASFAPLSITSDSLLPQASEVITVHPNVATQAAGTLKTTITIADRDAGTTVASQQVQVTINIQSQPQAAIAASPVIFSVTASSTGPVIQTLTVKNTGNAQLNWRASLHTDDGGTWLAINISSGILAPGATQTITVSCDNTGLSTGTTYKGTIQISDSDTGTKVTPTTVYLSFAA